MVLVGTLVELDSYIERNQVLLVGVVEDERHNSSTA